MRVHLRRSGTLVLIALCFILTIETLLAGLAYHILDSTLRLRSATRTNLRRVRNFLVGLGLVSMLGTRGRAYVYDWTRWRQRRAYEEKKKSKTTKQKMDRFMHKRRRD